MRKLILQMQTSVDGFVADQYGDTSWMVWSWGNDWTWDTKLQQYHIDTTASADCVLLSDRMADEGFIDHWARVAMMTENPQSSFAKNIAKAHKAIFSKRPKESTWDNAEVITGDLKSEVSRLKSLPGKNLIAFGGAGFASSLVAAGLVDEFHFIVNPVALGAGLSIFEKLQDKLSLKLLDAVSCSNDIVVLKYAK